MVHFVLKIKHLNKSALMKAKDCLNAARKNLYSVRRHLESGYGINWVPDELSTAALWAIEAWLIAMGHKRSGMDWAKIRLKFKDVAPKDLYDHFDNCMAGASSLDFYLFGDSAEVDGWPPFDPDKWKKDAWQCLEDTERLVERITREVEKKG